jgi:hypothetical protein
MPDGHQQAADIGEAEAQGAVLVGQFRDLVGGELRHHHRDFQHDGPQPDGMLVIGNVERLVSLSLKRSRFSEARLQAVSSRNMYSEHGLEARIGPAAGQVCQSLMVVCTAGPDRREAQAAWPIFPTDRGP